MEIREGTKAAGEEDEPGRGRQQDTYLRLKGIHYGRRSQAGRPSHTGGTSLRHSLLEFYCSSTNFIESL